MKKKIEKVKIIKKVGMFKDLKFQKQLTKNN